MDDSFVAKEDVKVGVGEGDVAETQDSVDRRSGRRDGLKVSRMMTS